MAAPTAGPVADFCAALGRLVSDCGVSQREIADALGLSAGSVSELLGGRRRKVPDWDVVRTIVALCADRNGTRAAPSGMRADVQWWKSRHAELERTAEAARGRVERAAGAIAPTPARRGDATTRSHMGVEEAVSLLAGGRMAPMATADALMKPQAIRSKAQVLDVLLRHVPARVRAAHGVERAVLIQAARVVLVAAAAAGTWSPERADGLIRELADGTHTGHGAPLPEVMDRSDSDTARHVLDTYLRLATPLARACREFALVAGVPSAAEDGEAAGPPATGLAGLEELLSECTGGHGDFTPHRALLHEPIASLDAPGPRLPSLAEGYVTPRFRVAGPNRTEIASDKWWETRPLHDDIGQFLAAHLLGLPALLAPLVVLGHPGAGKSLLTRLLTARLPAGEFRPLRVELRHAPAEADVQAQLEHALARATGRKVSWPDWSEESDALPVVLLDGFDELLQAAAQKLGRTQHWGYLQEITDFQRREAGLGRPLIVLVTSRTVVADRANVPYTSRVIRLEPFDEPEIERWLTVWNGTNAHYFARNGLLPLTPEVVLPHRDLAAQPLLLLMLALYDASGNALHLMRDHDISRTELYDRLLREFVRRQVTKDGSLPPAEADAAVDRELRRLSVIALSMFHRGSQSISGEEADRDLRGLGAVGDGSGLLFGRFFFVHEAQAVVAEERLRSYEFMHATFGEHLAARLIEGALRRLDDGELYALLSFAPLTDRAELVQNLRDMLASQTEDHVRTVLVPALVERFRAAGWGPERHTATGYAPVRLRRAYRDAVYEVNLVLVAVLAAGEVYASEVVDSHHGVAHGWRRHALQWQGQLTVTSWAALTSTLHPERCWRHDPHAPGHHVQDLRLTTRPTPLADHDFTWLRWTAPPKAVRSLSAGLQERLSSSAPSILDLIRRVSFAADTDTEFLLHIGYPVLLQWPSAMSMHVHPADERLHSAGQALVALLTRDVYAPEALPSLYEDCLARIGILAPKEREPYAEAVLCHLVHDAPALRDDDLTSVITQLHHVFSEGDVVLTEAAERALLDCIRHALDRGNPDLADAANAPRTVLTGSKGTPLQSLLTMIHLSRSTHTWQRSSSLRGKTAARHFDKLLEVLCLPTTATTHPSALIDLLRLASELALDDWLATRAPEILAALPATAFGLLRPSDLTYLRAALPPGAYAEQFEEVERAWRGPEPTSPGS
ncbi:helix-turn-helix domain-containing protein [Streptomyces sp. NRAIS4]